VHEAEHGILDRLLVRIRANVPARLDNVLEQVQPKVAHHVAQPIAHMGKVEAVLWARRLLEVVAKLLVCAWFRCNTEGMERQHRAFCAAWRASLVLDGS